MRYWKNNTKNICGEKIRKERLKQKLTQDQLTSKLQLAGFDFEKLVINRIENNTRFVADFELKAIAKVLNLSYDYLLNDD